MPGPAFDHRMVLVDSDPLGLTKAGNLYVFQLDVGAFGDGLAPGEAGNVLQHSLTLIPEAGCPDGSDLQRATQFSHNQSGQRLAPNILCDYKQRLSAFRDLLNERKQVFFRTDFRFVNENAGVFKATSIRSGSVMK